MAAPTNASDDSPLLEGEDDDSHNYPEIESAEEQQEETPPGPDESESIRILLRRMSWRKRLTVIVASFVNFAALACFAMMAPFLPLEASAKGVDGTAVGMIFASFEGSMVIANILFGRFISAIGARFMYISGIMIAAICAILFGILEWCPPGQAFLAIAISCRMVEGIGTSMCQTASMAIVANEFPDRVATLMGLLETFSGLGLMVGPAIGGALYQLGGFFLPFVVMGGIFSLTGLFAWFVLPQAIVAEPKDRSELFRKFLSIPTVWFSGIAVSVFTLAITFLNPILSKHLASIDKTLANNGALIGLVFIVEPALYAFLSPFIGYIADKAKYPMILMLVGNLGFFAAGILIGPCPLLGLPADAVWLPIVGMALIGLFAAFSFVPAFAVMNKASIEKGLPNDIDLYGLIAGFFGTAANIGAFGGPLIGGALGQHFGFAWTTSIVALVPLADAVVLAIVSFALYILPAIRS